MNLQAREQNSGVQAEVDKRILHIGTIGNVFIDVCCLAENRFYVKKTCGSLFSNTFDFRKSSNVLKY